MRRLITLTNPHRKESFDIKELSSNKQIWKILANPDKIDYISEVVSGENIHTEISVGGRIFVIDCTAEALINLINSKCPRCKRITIK